jgi:hypothetical protein
LAWIAKKTLEREKRYYKSIDAKSWIAKINSSDSSLENSWKFQCLVLVSWKNPAALTHH